MVDMIKMLATLAAWVAVLGVPLGYLIPRPNMTPEISLTTWMILLGVIFTAVVRPAWQRFRVWFKNICALRFALYKIPPESEQDAEMIGIKSPLDYCIYMAANQVVPIVNLDRSEDYYAVTDEGYGPMENETFRKMYGRRPLSGYKTQHQYYFVSKETGTSIMCDRAADMWLFCIKEEAAKLAQISADDVTPEVVEEKTSQKIKPYLRNLSNMLVLKQI